MAQKPVAVASAAPKIYSVEAIRAAKRTREVDSLRACLLQAFGNVSAAPFCLLAVAACG